MIWDLPNPTDLLGRLTAILLVVGVAESVQRGLLGDPDRVIATGDGSVLVTGAAGTAGHKRCECPSIPRSTTRYAALMRLRSGCERSNAAKKAPFRLQDARHRRASFWLIRLHLIALLQLARAWVAGRSALDIVHDLICQRAAA